MTLALAVAGSNIIDHLTAPKPNGHRRTGITTHDVLEYLRENPGGKSARDIGLGLSVPPQIASAIIRPIVGALEISRAVVRVDAGKTLLWMLADKPRE